MFANFIAKVKQLRFIIYILFKFRGDRIMYEFLAYRVITGHLTCIPEKVTKTKRLVPERLRSPVLEILEESGFDGDGQPLASEQSGE
ncbi:hypothetical protein HMPREF9629_00604 [Peptoanaerobacter stomatis]|uniref:Uncharacterized protein n=2 Tax=Peptoanaerobacter stomatis TaxID=796937 RepID=G9X2J7_9FIRM|nr:hypothetical protein HMPREF9629_00604 [Peptoanaerobacter stomatis]